MKILFPVDEATGIYKIGGLGDVGSSLPKALVSNGVDVRIVLPAHPEIDLDPYRLSKTFDLEYGGRILQIELFEGTLPGTDIVTYLVSESYYIRKMSDASDSDIDKFAVFSAAVAFWVQSLTDQDWLPEIVHLHEWHTGLIPSIVKEIYHDHRFKYVLNLHNMAYQGRTDLPVLQKVGFSQEYEQVQREQSPENKLNLLLEGIKHADHLVPVSPQYSKEIITSEYGEGLESYLEGAISRTTGILNGLDLELFNPSVDPYLEKKYDFSTFEQGKAAAKVGLQKELSLPQNSESILIGFVGRVDAKQKGVQLIIDALQKKLLLEDTHQLVFLGVGDPNLESELKKVGTLYPQVRTIFRFDEALAIRIYAASDIMIIPSKFEPCGLVQLIAMRYGAIPVARSTGGLVDTILDSKDGYLFTDYSTEAFVHAINRAVSDYQNIEVRSRIIKAAMTKSFDWYQSALQYINIYASLTHGIEK